MLRQEMRDAILKKNIEGLINVMVETEKKSDG